MGRESSESEWTIRISPIGCDVMPLVGTCKVKFAIDPEGCGTIVSIEGLKDGIYESLKMERCWDMEDIGFKVLPKESGFYEGEVEVFAAAELGEMGAILGYEWTYQFIEGTVKKVG